MWYVSRQCSPPTKLIPPDWSTTTCRRRPVCEFAIAQHPLVSRYAAGTWDVIELASPLPLHRRYSMHESIHLNIHDRHNVARNPWSESCKVGLSGASISSQGVVAPEISLIFHCQIVLDNAINHRPPVHPTYTITSSANIAHTPVTPKQ